MKRRELLLKLGGITLVVPFGWQLAGCGDGDDDDSATDDDDTTDDDDATDDDDSGNDDDDATDDDDSGNDDDDTVTPDDDDTVTPDDDDTTTDDDDTVTPDDDDTTTDDDDTVTPDDDDTTTDDDDTVTPDDDDAAPVPCSQVPATGTANSHGHVVTIPLGDLQSPPSGGGSYIATGGHPHTVTLSQQDLVDLATNCTLTTTNSSGHAHTWTITIP